MWRFLLKPWVLAIGSGATTYLLARKTRGDAAKLREAKLELLEQQRAIDRLRAELGRERALRQEESAQEQEKEMEPSD